MTASALDGTFPLVLAHQGGWDEILMILGPLAIVGAALWFANRRANQLQQPDHDHGSTSDD